MIRTIISPVLILLTLFFCMLLCSCASKNKVDNLETTTMSHAQMIAQVQVDLATIEQKRGQIQEELKVLKTSDKDNSGRIAELKSQLIVLDQDRAEIRQALGEVTTVTNENTKKIEKLEANEKRIRAIVVKHNQEWNKANKESQQKQTQLQ